MDLREVKSLKFKRYRADANKSVKITTQYIWIGEEKGLVVDFLRNENMKDREEIQNTRILLLEEPDRYKVFGPDGRQTKKYWNQIRSSFYHSIETNDVDRKRIHRFVNENKDDKYGTLSKLNYWMRKVDKEELDRKRGERGELRNDDWKLCSDEMPEFLPRFVRENILTNINEIVYKKGNVKGRCFVCGEEVRAERHDDRFLANKRMDCPNCYGYVVCKHENSADVDYVGTAMTVEKAKDGETVFFRQWKIERDMTAQWTELERYIKEVARYAIRGDKTAKWQKESKYPGYFNSERYELEEWTRWENNLIYDNAYTFCPIGLKEALQGTKMQYADWEGYIESVEVTRRNTVHFLQYHAKYPVIEFLWKQGYTKLVDERVNRMWKGTQNVILWRKKSVKEAFKVPLYLLRMLEPSQWTLEKLKKVEEWHEAECTEEEMKLMLKTNVEPRHMMMAERYASRMKILRYIEKQQEKGGIGQYQSGIEFRDYIDECEALRLDLTNKSILFPKNLERAHERTAGMVKFEKNKADQEKFEKAVEKLLKYEYEYGNYKVVVPRDQKELQKEGERLNHCVGGYIKRMADGETAILFIREKGKLQESFYTMELKGKKVIQCRTKNNKTYEMDENVTKFVEKWLKTVVNGRKLKKGA